MLWKKLLSLLLLSLLLSQSLFSEYVLTDEAYERLMELQKTSESLTASDKLTIQELETELSLLEKKQTISEQITALDQILITKQETSLKEQNTDSFMASLEIFFWGLVVGLIGGFYSGFKLGL
jgi:hypothetical protein